MRVVGNYMELIYPEFLRFKDRVCGTLDRIICVGMGSWRSHLTVNQARKIHRWFNSSPAHQAYPCAYRIQSVKWKVLGSHKQGL